MSRRVAAVVAAIACLAAAPDPSERLPDPGQEARARVLFKEVRCVVCQNESIDDSDAELASDLRALVREQVAAGRSDKAIRSHLVERYGEFVLFRPRWSAANALLWAGPLAVLLAGAGWLAFSARKTARRASALNRLRK